MLQARLWGCGPLSQSQNQQRLLPRHQSWPCCCWELSQIHEGTLGAIRHQRRSEHLQWMQDVTQLLRQHRTVQHAERAAWHRCLQPSQDLCRPALLAQQARSAVLVAAAAGVVEGLPAAASGLPLCVGPAGPVQRITSGQNKWTLNNSFTGQQYTNQQVTPKDACINDTHLDYRLSRVGLHDGGPHRAMRSWRSAVPAHISSSAHMAQGVPRLITSRNSDATVKRSAGQVRKVRAAKQQALMAGANAQQLSCSLRLVSPVKARPMSILPSAGRMACKVSSQAHGAVTLLQALVVSCSDLMISMCNCYTPAMGH